MNTPTSHTALFDSFSLSLGSEDLYPLIECRHCDPHRILGVRGHTAAGSSGSIARAYYPGAVAVSFLFEGGRRLPLLKVHADGLFEASTSEVLPSSPNQYQIEVSFADGSSLVKRDPYAFAPQLGELDLYLLGRGEHHQAYKVMGAHPRMVDGIGGTSFAVWAPNAQRVSVVGDFNGWDGRFHMMRQ